ncbi:energy-coupling factor ABC transporter ATP-binding protein [Virgibacillus sp. FSP13]
MCLELKDVTVEIEGERILDQVSCQMDAGRWVSIIGKSGAGKSTLLRVMKGLIPWQSGVYTYRGNLVEQDFKGMTKRMQKMGLVFQYPEKQLFHTTAYKELAFGLKQKGLSKKDMDNQIQASIRQFGLHPPVLQKSPFQLSGGQRRRLALASVLITDPDILLIDEPTAGLDPGARKSILRHIKHWQTQGERTVVFTSHQMEDVMRYSDEVIVMGKGEIKAQLDTDALFLHHAEIVENNGLLLPLSIQLLRYVEQKTGMNIHVEKASDEVVFTAIRKTAGLE